MRYEEDFNPYYLYVGKIECLADELGVHKEAADFIGGVHSLTELKAKADDLEERCEEQEIKYDHNKKW